MLHQDADSEHQDVMQEVSVVQKEIQFHDMSFGAEFLNLEGQLDKNDSYEEDKKVIEESKGPIQQKEKKPKKVQNKLMSQPRSQYNSPLSSNITLTRLPQLPDKRNWGENF